MDRWVKKVRKTDSVAGEDANEHNMSDKKSITPSHCHISTPPSHFPRCTGPCEICQIPRQMRGSWESLLGKETSREYFKSILVALHNSYFLPPAEDVLKCLSFFELLDTKAVIIGQDPYHGPGQAMGLAFSVNKGISVPPSLKNIYKEIDSTIGYKAGVPKDGSLIGWAKQGVLLLNATLTVAPSSAGSHYSLRWHLFTDRIIECVSSQTRDCVFLLWGSDAQKKKMLIDASRHLILCSVHPSPLSASRGFFGCDHFRKANEYLKCRGRDPIDWTNERG